MANETTVEVREDNNALGLTAKMLESLEAPSVDGDDAGEQGELLEVDNDGRIVKDVKTDEGTPGTDEKKVDEKKVEDGSGKSDKESEDKTPVEDPRDKAISELRAIAREQRKELSVAKATLERMNKVQQGEIGDTTHAEPSELEKLSQSVQQIQQDRKQFLTEVKSLMEVNPKFEDVDSVVTPRRISDIVELAAKSLAPKYSRDEVSMGLLVEKEIWSMANPYKYLYELIKENHPDFVKAKMEEGGDVDGDGKEKKEEIKHPDSKVTKEKTPVTTPTTLSSISSVTQNNGGWTSARIDALSELELSKVPGDIYTAYLMGELP